MKKHILVVDDDKNIANYFKTVLESANYIVDVSYNAHEALEFIEKKQYDALLSDWLMPGISGIELIKSIRKKIKYKLVIIMVTALNSDKSKGFALDSGADYFLGKPVNYNELISKLNALLSVANQQVQAIDKSHYTKKDIFANPEFIAVPIATSTGGPSTLLTLFSKLQANLNAAYFIVQHGPDWMLESFAQRLNDNTPHQTIIPKDGEKITPGRVYLAAGNRHLTINSFNYSIKLLDTEPENMFKPSADPMFRSIASSFGKYSIGIVLTGLGKDGSLGALEIKNAGGLVIVQTPQNAIAPYMPENALKIGLNDYVYNIEQIPDILTSNIITLNKELK